MLWARICQPSSSSVTGHGIRPKSTQIHTFEMKHVVILEGSHNLSTFWHSLQHSPSLNCEDDEFFAGFLKDLNWAIGQGESLVGKLSKWLFAPKVQELEMDQLRQSNWEPPCRLGWIAIMILKASIGWHTEPRTFFTYAESLRPYLMLLSLRCTTSF